MQPPQLARFTDGDGGASLRGDLLVARDQRGIDALRDARPLPPEVGERLIRGLLALVAVADTGLDLARHLGGLLAGALERGAGRLDRLHRLEHCRLGLGDLLLGGVDLGQQRRVGLVGLHLVGLALEPGHLGFAVGDARLLAALLLLGLLQGGLRRLHRGLALAALGGQGLARGGQGRLLALALGDLEIEAHELEKCGNRGVHGGPRQRGRAGGPGRVHPRDGPGEVRYPSRVQVPLVDLRAAFEPIEERVFAEWRSVLEGMQLFQGPHLTALESEFATYVGAEHGLALSNGTDALFAALRACGVGPGDEVIAPSHTFFATIEAIAHCGATPVLADVEPDTLTLDPGAVADLVGERTRAIVPVHLYGQAADMDPLLALARERGLRVVEDAAQAHGARYKGRPCGSLGDAASFSFYFTKNLGGVGEGGFVATGDAEVAERVSLLRHHGHRSKFEHAIIGHNLRMDELHAVVLRAKLERLDEGQRTPPRRRRPLRRPLRGRSGAGAGASRSQRARLPLLAIRVDDRDGLVAFLAERGVGTGIHYKTPGHLQPAMQTLAHRTGKLENTEQACREICSLPMYPELRDEQIEYVAEQGLEFVRRQ